MPSTENYLRLRPFLRFFFRGLYFVEPLRTFGIARPTHQAHLARAAASPSAGAPMPMPAIIFIIGRICRNCLTKPLTACGSTPEPRGDAPPARSLDQIGLRRSLGVIDVDDAAHLLHLFFGQFHVLQLRCPRRESS
jgi:hypothetical protein